MVHDNSHKPPLNILSQHLAIEKKDLPFLTSEEKSILKQCNPYLKNAFMSAFPGDESEDNTRKMHEILALRGVTNIFSLIPEEEMKGGEIKSYEPIVRMVKPAMQLHRFPIRDFSVADDEDVRQFVQENLLPRTANSQEVLLIHCQGGMGRSSTIAVIHTSMQLQINFEAALKHVFVCYLTRKAPLAYIPESEEQFKQMQKLCIGTPSKMTLQEWRQEAKEIVRAMRPELLAQFTH